MPTTRTGVTRLQQLAPELARKIEQHQIPGATMAVSHHGAVSTAAAGYANAEAGIEADDRTVFQIGSITKVFTATLMMKFAEERLVELDAPVSRYLPDLRIADAPPPDSLTVRTLLDYSAGMDGDFFRDFGPGPAALARYVDACRELKYVHAPGAMRSYNTTSYCIAGRVIEVLAGNPYDDVLADRLLRPIGMERFASYSHDIARFRTAVGHLRRPGSEGFAVVDTLRLPHCMSPSGASLTTTARDLLRFGLLHLHGGATERGDRFLSDASIRQMRTPSRIVPPGHSELVMGWATLPTDHGALVVASGRTIEQNAFLFLLPDHEFCAAILTNSGDGGQRLFLDLGLSLIEDCTGAKVQIPTPPPGVTTARAAIAAADAEPYTGRYGNSYAFEVVHADERLRATLLVTDPTSGEVLRQHLTLIHLDADRFAAIPDGADAADRFVEFVRPGPSAKVATHLSSGGRLFIRQQ